MEEIENIVSFTWWKILILIFKFVFDFFITWSNVLLHIYMYLVVFVLHEINDISITTT